MDAEHTTTLRELLGANEDWLMDRVLQYAITQGYAAYTSTLKEAWRLSISGLSDSIIAGAATHSRDPELTPDMNFGKDPVAIFGSVEARKHRARGVSFGMFLGLMKYYRQAYVDLIKTAFKEPNEVAAYELFVNRIFDRIEIGFCVEWSTISGDEAIKELQVSNRDMTNEKNKYLTIFESIPTPVIILNPYKKIDNLNHSAAKLLDKNPVAGAHYYFLSNNQRPRLGQPAMHEVGALECTVAHGTDVSDFFPWLNEDLNDFIQNDLNSKTVDREVEGENGKLIFKVKISRNKDVSGKFKGYIIILEDITTLKNALAEAKTLRGLLPICVGCKSIRDDKGFWQRVEKYIEDNSDAAFTHGLCPTCAKKLYPELCK